MPLFLLLAGLLPYLRATGGARRAGPLLALPGLGFGLAAGAKLSYAFAPAIALAQFWMLGDRQRLLPLLAGLALAGLPWLHYLVLAPQGFLCRTGCCRCWWPSP